MNKQNIRCAPLVRKMLSVLMIVMLIVSIVAPNIVWAEETSTTTNGYYGADGKWYQGGDGTFSYNDGKLILSKTAVPVDGATNLFEITLQVSLKLHESIYSPNSIATVLVIDVSASMNACSECQSQTSHYSDCSKNTGFIFGSTVLSDETRLYAAKQAAIAFIDEMRKDAKEGSGRYVNLVSFSNYADNALSDWQDVTTTAGYNAVKNAINNLSATGGTNLDDGLGYAIELINGEKVSAVSKGGKNIIVLSDGKPTYYMNTSGTRQGNGSDSTKTMLDDTTVAATELKRYANVFTVCYNASDSGTYSGGPTVGKFLEDSVATPAKGDIKYAYDVDSASELIDSFMSIIDIEIESAGVTITDPIPDNITIPDNGLPDGIKYQDGIWSLHGIEPIKTIDGDYITYTYKIIYKVEIDPYRAGMEENKFYPANNPTYVVMGDGTTYEFPVPGVMPIPTKYEVTFNAGEHGSIEGEDNNGNVTYEITVGKDTPDAPEVTPDDGWYFVGWTPEVSDKVDGEVTYTAIYSQKQVITVTGNSNTVTYNGAEQTVSGYTVTGLPEGWTVSGIDYSVSGKNAGTYTGSFNGTPVIRNENNEIVPNEQYTLVLTTSTLTISKRDLTITADSDSKVYDGTALTNNGYTISGVAGSDNVASVIVTGSQTLVGQSANVASGAVVMNGNADVTANYNVIYVDGTLTVEKNLKEITIIADSASKQYDGTPLTDGGYTLDGAEIAQGDVLTVVVEGSQTNAGSSANKVVSYKVMRGNDDVTSFYSFATPVDGVLEVTKRDVTITADSASKEYDGTVLKDNGWNDTKPAGLADGDEVVSVTVEGGQLVVGSSYNVASDAVIMRGNDDVTANYNITYIDGTLTVTTVGTPITITANSNSKIYDGLPLYDGGYTFTQGILAEGDVLMVEVEGSITDAGTTTNYVASYKIMRNGVDVTDFYPDAILVDGTLTVEKRDLIITADSATKEYDGKELTDYGWLDTPPAGLATTDELVDVIVEGSQTLVGQSANVATYAYVVRGEDSVTDNYNITYVDGTLTVTKNTQTITITAESDSKAYDGFPLTNDNYTYTDGVIGIFDMLIVEVEGSQTNVGSSPNKVVSYKVMRNGVDVTEYYTFAAPVDGTLTVTKAEGEIIVEADSASKQYDGTPLTSDDFMANEDILAIGDELVVVVEGSQTYVGSSANKVVSIKVMRGDVDVTDNYNIGTPVDGTLTIEKIDSPIVIEANSASKEYDGTPLTNNGFTVIYDYVLVNGDEVVAVVEGSQTNVGSSENKVVSYKIMNGDKDVTDCYTIDVSNGILEVTSKSDVLTITAVSDSKVYDGTALVNGGYSFTQGILADGDILVVDVNGTQTFVGTGENEITSYKVMRGNDDVTANYSIETVNGTLEVTKRDLVITADSASKIYDGTALADNGWTVAGLADGDAVLSVVVTGGQTEVGQSANVASDAVVMRGNNDVTDNYNITYIDGTLTVSKVGTPIIITGASDSKIYDGTPLTNNDFTFTQGVLAQGDELIVVVEGSQTNAGISANKVVSYKVMRDGVDVTGFYTFATPVDGVLEVTKRDVTITAASDSKEYDGTEFGNDSYTADGLVTGEYIDSITVVGSQIFVGTSANVASGAVIMGADGETTDNYNITYVDGTITVTKKTDDITITAGSGSKEYDGTPLTSDEFTVTGELAEGDEIVAEIEGSQTLAGSSPNVVVSIKVIRDGVDVTDNYENLIPADGTLTIEKIETPIIITAGSSEKDYDGAPLTDGTYTFTEGVLIDGDELVVVIEGSQTEVGSSANKVVSVKVMRGEIDVTDCYTIDTFVDGELVVNEIPETGDNTNITIWNVMMFASLLTLLVLAFTSKRKQRAR